MCSLQDMKGISQKYVPLLNQPVTMKFPAPVLPITSYGQPHYLCRSLSWAKLRQPASLNDEPPRPSQSCGISRCKQCLPLTCSIYISSTANNKTFKYHSENTCCDHKLLFMILHVPSVGYNTWARVISFELAWMDTIVTSDSTPLVWLIRWTISFNMII